MEIRINGVNVFNPLEGKLDDIIECFVEFYGEKHREKITHNLKNTEYFFLPTDYLRPLKHEFLNYFKMEENDIYNEFYQKISPYGRKMPNEWGSYAIKIPDLVVLKHEINAICVEKKGGSFYLIEDKLNRVLQYLGVLKTAEDFAREKAEENNIPIDSFRFREMINEFRNEKKAASELKEYFENTENRQQFFEFVDMCEEKFVELGYEKIIEDLEQQKETAILEAKEIDEKIQSSMDKGEERINDFCLERINAALCEQGKQIEDEQKIINTYQYLLRVDLSQGKGISDYAKKDFIKFFNKFGFDLGDNLKDYLENLKIKQNLISEEIQSEFKNLEKENQKDLENSHQILSDCVSAVKKRELICGETNLMKSIVNYMYVNSGASAFVTVGTSEKGLETFLVCKSATSVDLDLVSRCDWELVHELGHIATTSSTLTENGDIGWKTGFDFTERIQEQLVGETTSVKEEHQEKRRYEALNEIINDYFTLDIYKLIREKGIVLNLGHQEQTSSSSYQYGFRLMEGFIESHKQEIKDSLMSDNPMAFAEIIGKENYDLLADACSEYLSLTTNMDNHIKFIQQVNALRAEFDAPFFVGVLLQEEWYGSSKSFADCFKKVALVERNIKIAKMQNPEMEVEKYDTEMDFHL